MTRRRLARFLQPLLPNSVGIVRQVGPPCSCGACESVPAAVVSAERTPVLVRGMQALRRAGLTLEDIADTLYSSPLVLDALVRGEHDEAKELALSRLRENLEYLRGSGVPEDRLRALSDSGLAVGEIAFAIRTVVWLRDELAEGDAQEAQKWAPVLHEFFRRGGRPTHSSPTGGRVVHGGREPGPTETQGPRFERYLKLTEGQSMAPRISVGQTFRASDGGIEVVVVRVGGFNERARFRIKNLSTKAATYTIMVHRKSGADPDRIKCETDNPEEYELSADETTAVEIRREQR